MEDKAALSFSPQWAQSHGNVKNFTMEEQKRLSVKQMLFFNLPMFMLDSLKQIIWLAKITVIDSFNLFYTEKNLLELNDNENESK
mgnify:CR=1 FL=1